jgi:hypothetical protein
LIFFLVFHWIVGAFWGVFLDSILLLPLCVCALADIANDVMTYLILIFPPVFSCPIERDIVASYNSDSHSDP